MKKAITTIVLLIVTASLLLAQDDDGEVLSDVIVLSDKIEIPFKKQNRNIQIISSLDIKDIPANSLPALLAYVSGIDVRQKGPNGTQADIGIDGATFDQVLVLVNGIKMSDPQTGHNMMNLPIPLDAIERIEILRGPAGRIYGVNALMGVINIVTKTYSDDLLLSINGGSSFQSDDSSGNAYYNYSISAVKNFSSEKAHHLLAVSLDKGNGYRYNTAFQNTKLLYAGDWIVSEKVKVNWTAGYVDNDFGASYFYAAPRDLEAAENAKTAILGVKVPIRVNEKWTLQPYLNYKYGYDHYVFVRQDPAIYENIHHTNTIDAGFDNILHTRFGTFNVGGNLRSETINSTNLGERQRINYGGFLEYQKQIAHFDLNVGMYLNQHSMFGFNVYPGLDVGYNIDQHWRLYVNAGMGQRMPTFTDLYYSDPGNLGNDQLRPEYITSYEIGTKYNKGNGYVNAAISYKDGRDFIDWVRADTLLPWQVQNFTSLHSWVFNLEYGQSWQAFNNMALRWRAGYTYLKPTITAVENGLPQISKYTVNALQHQLVLRLAADWNNKLLVSVGNKWVKRWNTPDEHAGYQLGMYNILDMQCAYRLGRMTITAEVNNLLNVQYIESGVVPMPGAWFSLGAKYKM